MTISVERLGDAFAVATISTDTVRCRCGHKLLDVAEINGFADFVQKCPRCKGLVLVKIKEN